MKKKHLWFLIPIGFATLYAELFTMQVRPSLVILALIAMGVSFLYALHKQE